MLDRIFALFRFRSRKPNAVESVADKSTTAEQTINPREAKIIFEFVGDLLLDWALRRYPTFNLDVLQTHNPEVYWQLVEFGVRVEGLKNPVRAEALRSFLTSYAIVFGDAAALTHLKSKGGPDG